MKLKPKITTTESVNSTTKVIRGSTLSSVRVVEIYHSQEVKQSLNWQSAGSTYGVKLIVNDNDKAIKAGIARAEQIVEESLVNKISQQRELLKSL